MSKKLKTFAYNSISNILVSISANIVSFMTLPFYINTYGEEKYGIYILALSMNAGLAIIDFGIGAGLKRFVAQFTADKDHHKISLVISPVLTIFLIIASLNALIITGISFLSSDLFNISSQYQELSILTFQMAAAYAIIFWLVKFNRAILEGYQLHWLYSISNAFQILASLVVFGIVFFYKIDFLWFCGLSFLTFLIPFLFQTATILKMKLLKNVRIKIGLHKADFKTEFFSISTDLFIIGIIAFFRESVDKYVIGILINSALVTIYIIITKPSTLINMISSMLFSAVDPLIAKEYKLGNQSLIDAFNKEGTLLHFMINTPLVIMGILFLKPFLNLWIGNEYDEYILWGQLCTFALFTKPYYSLMAKTILNTDSPKKIRNLNFISVGVNFTTSIVLTYFIGIGGVVIGTVIQEFIKVPLYSSYFKKYFQTNINTYLVKNLGIYFVISIIIAIAIHIMTDHFVIDSWIKLLSHLTGASIVFYLLGYVLLRKKIKVLQHVLSH